MNVFKEKYPLFITVLCLCLCGVFLLSLAFGSVKLNLFNLIFSSERATADYAQGMLIVSELRLPRALLAVLIGALLACSGTAMQGLFRNPLADPSLIGITAGASLGACMAIFFAAMGFFAMDHNAISELGSLTITSFGASIGGAISVIVVYRIATRNGITSVPTMLLAGIAFTAFASCITNLLEYFSDNETLRQLNLWRMGSLESASYMRVFIASIVALICLSGLWLKSTALNAFLLGESEARHLGIAVEPTKRFLIITVALACGIAVALAGTIAFVGLIVPHIMRIFVGPNHRRLLPASAIAGAIVLCAADLVSRLIIAPAELPVGLVIAFFGAPFFIALLRRNLHYGF